MLQEGKMAGARCGGGEAGRKPRAPGVCGHLRPHAELASCQGQNGKDSAVCLVECQWPQDCADQISNQIWREEE